MIAIELPELAVYNVKVFVAEVRGDLVNVLLMLENADHREQITPSQFRHRYLAAPAPVNAIKYPGDYLCRIYKSFEKLV